MNSIFGRLATILVISTFAIFLGINIFNFFMYRNVVDGYYSFTGLSSLSALFDRYDSIVNNSWLTLEGFIRTALLVYQTSPVAFVASALTWFLPYIIMCLFGNVGTILFLIFELFTGAYSFTYPHIY